LHLILHKVLTNILRIKSKDQVDPILDACKGVINKKVAAGLYVPHGLHFAAVASIGLEWMERCFEVFDLTP
jgi:hypothetical protein